MKSRLTVLVTVTLMMVGLSFAPVHSVKATPPPSSFVGTWQTTWKATDGRTVSAPVSIKGEAGNANALDGVVEAPGPNGLMYGTLSPDGKTWSGNWWNNDGTHGTFTFTLKDGKNFTGSYTQAGASGNFDWHGNK